jgi:hypothetical protein
MKKWIIYFTLARLFDLSSGPVPISTIGRIDNSYIAYNKWESVMEVISPILLNTTVFKSKTLGVIFD